MTRGDNASKSHDVVCPSCKAHVDELFETLASGRAATCPHCGATDFLVHIGVADVNAPLEDAVKFMSKEKMTSKKRLVEGFASGDVHRASGVKNWRSLMVNRASDEYHEVITSPDGEIIREVHEALSEHQGHGSAKKKRRASPE